MAESELTISHSQLGTWNKCRFAYNLSYVQNWTKKDSAIYFVRGGEIHTILADYYSSVKEGTIALGDPAPVKTWIQSALSRDVDYELVDQIGWLLQRYILDYSVYEDRDVEIVEVEKELTIDLETPKGRTVTLHGFIDLLKKVNGKYWLVDHKSAGNASFWSEDEIQMDSQLPTYQALLNRHGYDIFGCEFNFLNTYAYKKREEVSTEKLFKRARTYRTQAETDNILNEFALACDDIIDNRSNIRRSLTKDCARCVFFDPCHLSLKGMNVEELMPAGFKQKGQEEVKGEAFSDVEAENSFGGSSF